MLPASGRQGEPPDWPLEDPRKRELTQWQRLWRLPQAIEWERLGWQDVVARYVRLLVDAERVMAPVPLLAEVRQMEDRLGLSPLALLRLRWVIVDDDQALDQGADAQVLDIRKRLRATD